MQGPVRVSAPPLLASHFLVPQLAARAAQWHGIELDLVGEVRSANLLRREADVAVRLLRPDEPGLTARRIGSVSFRLYGTRSWAQIPEAQWCFVGYGVALNHLPQQRLLARMADGRPFVLRSYDLAALFQACCAGLGVAMLPSFLALQAPALVQLACPDGPVFRDIWSVVHQDLRRSARVRLIADLIGEVMHQSADALA